MKPIILIVAFTFSSLASASIYYVAPSGGNDKNAGTNIAAPWATWNRALNASEVSAGDTVYFRGGTWKPTSRIWVTKNGTSSNYIHYWAYPGEVPICDFTNKKGGGEAIFFLECSYLHIKGLIICNNHDGAALDKSGWAMQFDGPIIFEQCVSHSNDCRGFYLCSYTSVTLINCDSYNNVDPVDGNNGEGFVFIRDNTWNPHPTYSATITGCRAWGNSDSGFSSNYGDVETYINCWSFDNGRVAGEGCGFKYLPSVWLGAGVKGRIIRNCIAAHNGHGTTFKDCASGFEENGADGSLCDYTIDNCFIYDNYNAAVRTIGGTDYGTTRLFRNCISYANGKHTELNNGNPPTFLNNSWQNPPNVTVSPDDFQSLDWRQMYGARKSDGSLPDITFGRLVEGSDLIDAGIDVGLPYNGDAPDLGYSEYPTGSSTSSFPIYESSVIQNISPARLDMTYNLTLANIVPAARRVQKITK